MNELNELERTKLENYTLKILLMQQQLQQQQMERTAFIRKIENNHPGYEWQEPQGLVRIDYDDVQPQQEERQQEERYPEFTPH